MMHLGGSPKVLAVAITAILINWSAPVAAQVGSGWTEYAPPRRVQTRGCATHAAAGGVETFTLTCDSASGDNRAEQRIENDYSSGTRQFEGEVRVVSLGGSNVSLKQTFMPNNGAFLMLAVGTGGRLYSVGDNGELATGVIGQWVRINTVHDVAAGTHQIYVDGVLKVTKPGGRPVAWHDKYGTYRLGSGRGPIAAEWRNVKYFRDGKASGGTPPGSPSDAGAPEAGSEAGGGSGGQSGAGGSGGASGTSGTGGDSGSGGAAGASGTGGGPGGSGTGGGAAAGRGGSGQGGSSGSDPDPPAGSSEAGGCGCALGGARPAPPVLALLAAWLLAGAIRRRRR